MRKLRAFRFDSLIHANGDNGGGGGNPPAPQPPAPTPPEPETFSKDYVKELRQEAAGYRLKYQESERKAQEADERAKKAAEEADGKVASANSAAEQRIIRAELKAEALKAGIVDLDGLALADLSAVKLNDKGEVEGGADAIAKLKESKPYLFGEKKSTSSTESPPKPKDLTKKTSAKDMTDDEWKAEKRKLGIR